MVALVHSQMIGNILEIIMHKMKTLLVKVLIAIACAALQGCHSEVVTPLEPPKAVAIGDKWTNSIAMKFTYIPAGQFVMGSPPNERGRDDDEYQHNVRITKPFMMQTTEVTQEQWKAVMGSFNNPSYFSGSDLPVEEV